MGGKALLLVNDVFGKPRLLTMEVGLLTSEEGETLLLWNWKFLRPGMLAYK